MERALLALLGASCDLALGAYGTVDGDAIVLEAALERDGALARARARASNPETCARLLAGLLGSHVHAR